MAKALVPVQVIRTSRRAVKAALRKAVTPTAFQDKAPQLTERQRELIVQQAIMVLEGLYVNLPHKRAMYAVDPLRRLRLLLQRLDSHFYNDRLFHHEMTQIFSSLGDLHANYFLPKPYKDASAWLPFAVEFCFDEEGQYTYLATKVLKPWFKGTSFDEGVEILSWNGVPMYRAVEMAGAQSPTGAGNIVARHALGLFSLTQRPLEAMLPPDEEWVTVGYRTRRGSKEQEVRVHWVVSEVPGTEEIPLRGISVVTAGVQKIRRFLFAPDDDAVFWSEDLPVPPYGKIGYLRIYTFDVDEPDKLLNQLVKAISKLSQDGLIIDVRENPGGRARVAEQLLQVVAPRLPIEPERLYLVSTPLTLELCQLQKDNPDLGPKGAAPWIKSIQRSMETGAPYSASFPYTDQKACNVEGYLRYPGPVIVITDGLTRSAAEVFAAGFQDHGGKILGVHSTTSGAGSNARKYTQFAEYFRKSRKFPFKPLPGGADFLVAFRRYLRVGDESGNDIEDFGVRCDYRHRMTRNDILSGNVDLIRCAVEILRDMKSASNGARTRKSKPAARAGKRKARRSRNGA
jgi:C-terminal processing protease CtpA/Prc